MLDSTLDSTSDHSTLALTVPIAQRAPTSAGRLLIGQIDKELYTSRLASYPLPQAPQLDTPEALDKEAADLTSAILSVAKCLAPRTKESAQGNPWWTKQCTEAVQARQRPGGARRARRTITKAKAAYYQNQIANATVSKEVFRIAGWHRLEGVYSTVPLQAGQGALAVSGIEKATLLRQKILVEAASAIDIPPEASEPGTEALAFPLPEEEEVRQALLEAGNTAPGDDEITMPLLRLAWPPLAKRLTALCRAALRLGHHPHPFRSADVVFIPKPGKRDRSLPKSYRPISYSEPSEKELSG